MFTFQILNNEIHSYTKKPSGTLQFGKIGVLVNDGLKKLGHYYYFFFEFRPIRKVNLKTVSLGP